MKAFLLAALLLAPGLAAADNRISPADAAQIRAVLDVVRTSCRAAYRPAAVTFLDLRVIGADAVQRLQVTDSTGTQWLAYWAMQRQRDGSWRTSGCHLVAPVRTISAAYMPTAMPTARPR